MGPFFKLLEIMKTASKIELQHIFKYDGTYTKTFDFKATDHYDPINNYLMAQLCGLVYDTEEEIILQVNKWNKNTPSLKLKLTIVDIDSNRFMVVSNDIFLIVVFRGTQNMENWLSDFDIALVPFQNNQDLLVHQGFYQSVLDMGSKLEKIVSNHQKNDQKVYLTGHSLGAAQAILSAFVYSELETFSNVYTFGEPKIGDWGLTKHFNLHLNSSPPSYSSRIYRNINSMDPVPYVPIFYGLRFYYHEGLFYLFAPTIGAKYVIETTGDLGNERIIDLPQKELLGWNPIHHAIGDYIENAAANKQNNVFLNRKRIVEH